MISVPPMMQDANASSDATPENSLPLPSPPQERTPPNATAAARPKATARQPRSPVWKHFIKADDYETSKKADCMYCDATLTASGGSTSSMLQHLEKKHPDMLTQPDDAESPDR
jgi:BED zinc finger